MDKDLLLLTIEGFIKREENNIKTDTAFLKDFKNDKKTKENISNSSYCLEVLEELLQEVKEIK